MSSDARSLIRSAQAAELEGDLAQARFLLEQAAKAFESAGNVGRAEQLRRHKDRLVPQGTKLQEASAPRVELKADATGPVLAARGTPAWCSFCCRPQGDVGPLVSGPSDAFICGGCARLAAVQLGGETQEASRPPVSAAVTPAQVLTSQLEATQLHPRRSLHVLLLGPAGSGKTFWLQQWAANGWGSYVSAEMWRSGARLPDETLLLDNADRLDLQRLENRTFVLAVTGALPPPPEGRAAVESDRGGWTRGSDELAHACGQRIPLQVLEQVTRVVELGRMAQDDLVLLAGAWAHAHGLGEEEKPRLDALAARARGSARQAHELYALLGRTYPDAVGPRARAGEGP